MSRLILTGDTNANFGKLIPTPYISQIYISTDGVGDSGAEDLGKIDAEINIYVRADEYSDDATLINQIKNFKFYWHVATTSTVHNSDTWDDWSIDDLIDKKYSIWSIFGPGPNDDNDYTGWNGGAPSDPGAGYFTIAELIDSDSGEIEYEAIYDDEGNRVLKFVYSSLYRGGTVTLEKNSRIGYNLKLDGTASVTGDIYLFAWCLPVEPAHAEAASSGPDYDDNWGRLLDLQTSAVAYELLWTDDAPATNDEVTWVDEDGNAYDGIPLQSISSQYYSVDSMTHADIVSSFQDILDAYESLAEDDDPLQDMLDQVSYVLAIYALKADLLPQLNLVRRVFPSKSSVTNVGQFYIAYRDAIYNTNTVIETGTLLSKEEVINTKVIDHREISLTWGEAPTYDGTVSRSALALTDTFVSNLTIGKASLAGDNFCNYGFVFFDYKRALYEAAAIGITLDMNILMSILGQEIFTKYFRLTKTKFQRSTSGWTGTWKRYMITEYDEGYAPTDIEHVVDSDYTDYCPPYLSNGDDCFAYSFVLLRNFELDQEGGWDDYLMMCFEIQELLSESALVGSALAYELYFYVYIEDSTLLLISDLISAYKDAIGSEAVDGSTYSTATGLTDYVALASADCVFSTIDNTWTDSFAEEMHTEYDGDIGNAPWIYYPTYYALHKELLTKEFDGDMAAVMTEAQQISARINPDYGSLTELEAFQEDFIALYTDHYASGGTLASYNESLDTGESDSEYVVPTTYDKAFYQTWQEIEGAPGAPVIGAYEEFIEAYDGDETICEGAQYAVTPPTITEWEDVLPTSMELHATNDSGDDQVVNEGTMAYDFVDNSTGMAVWYYSNVQVADIIIAGETPYSDFSYGSGEADVTDYFFFRQTAGSSLDESGATYRNIDFTATMTAASDGSIKILIEDFMSTSAPLDNGGTFIFGPETTINAWTTNADLYGQFIGGDTYDTFLIFYTEETPVPGGGGSAPGSGGHGWSP